MNHLQVISILKSLGWKYHSQAFAHFDYYEKDGIDELIMVPKYRNAHKYHIYLRHAIHEAFDYEFTYQERIEIMKQHLEKKANEQ